MSANFSTLLVSLPLDGSGDTALRALACLGERQLVRVSEQLAALPGYILPYSGFLQGQDGERKGAPLPTA